MSGLAPLRLARYTVLGPLSDNEGEREKIYNRTRQGKGEGKEEERKGKKKQKKTIEKQKGRT